MEIKLWKEILMPYSLVVDELVTKFRHISLAYHKMGQYSPIYSVEGRVKSIPSIIEKAMRKKLTLDNFENEITDIAGIRIICQFVDDCPKVAELIRKRTDMTVIEETDYITNPKESGYRSFHMLVRYTVQLLDGPRNLIAEIQIRTMGMNCWSTIEHSLQYKFKEKMPEEIKKTLNDAAEKILISELEMSKVRDEVASAMSSREEDDNLVSYIILTILNIYQHASRREAIRIQEEFLDIYRSGDFDKLRHFAQELDVIAENYGQQNVFYLDVLHQKDMV